MVRGFWKSFVAGSLVALAAISVGRPASAGFYDAAPAELHGPPGSLIRAEVWERAAFGTVYRVLYRSKGLAGEPIAVSGLVVQPLGHPPAGGRHVVAWAHPTSGVTTPCAPSLKGNVLQTIPGLNDILSRGYVVAATDYPGLGTPGPHPYLIGESEGRAVLDSVRAARAIGEVGAGDRFAVWGHSQGGHAALFAGEIAKGYAPELKLVGVAAAAPAVELRTLFREELNTDAGNVLIALAVWSWAELYKEPLEKIVEFQALAGVDAIARECLETVSDALHDRRAEKALAGGFLTVDPTRTAPWSKIMVENSPGRHHPGAPLFIARSMTDADVPPAVSLAFVEGLCRKGAAVRVETLERVIHMDMGRQSAPVAVGWIGDRFDGVPAPTSCP